MTRHAIVFRARESLVGAHLWLLLGCPESGLDAYNKGDEPYEGDTPDEPSGPPQILLDECPTLCAQAYIDLAPLGCSVTCDVDLGTSYEGNASVTVLSLLTVEGDGEFQSGGSCDVVVDCEDIDDCRYLTLSCMDDSSNEISHCMDEYLQCRLEETCQELLVECADVAESANAACIDAGNSDCAEVFAEYLDVCNCAYDDCVGTMSEQCEEGAAPPPVPPPLKTGPTQWRVSRMFIQRQLNRLAGLQTETFLMVMPNAGGVPTGLSLRSIAAGDALHQLGLRDGDILLAVGNHPVVELIASPLPLLDLVDAPQVRLTLLRNGATRHHEYLFVP
jgi:hypothetical protein